jgi:hypothetical protein
MPRLGCATAVLAVAGGAGCGDQGERERQRTPVRSAVAVSKPAVPAGYRAARVVERTAVRTRPGGRVVARVGRRTEWDSPRYLSVVREVRRWVGVVTAERPNGHIGWVRRSKVKLVPTPSAIHVDLSRRLAWVSRKGRVGLRFRVAVGGPSTPTPTGRFGVTDALYTKGASPYGCCILALSAHQPNIPQGWTGGDRVAIHATPAVSSIGRAVTNGCLRTTDRTMRRLFRAVALGAPVFIRA